jgi:hypothetical protein
MSADQLTGFEHPLCIDPTTGFPKRPVLAFTRKLGWVVIEPIPNNRTYVAIRHTHRRVRIAEVLEAWKLPPVPASAA